MTRPLDVGFWSHNSCLGWMSSSTRLIAHFHPTHNPTLLLDPDAKVIGVSPLGLQVIHVVWRVQILFRAFDRCLAIGLLQT